MHQDQDIRIDNQRHAGIVIKDGKILLMERRYKGYEFWVFPGGHIRKEEDPFAVVEREIKEETTIIVKNQKLVFEFRDYFKYNFDFYYLCEYISGEPRLSGEELTKNSSENFYNPCWIDLPRIIELNVLPRFAKEWVEESILKK